MPFIRKYLNQLKLPKHSYDSLIRIKQSDDNILGLAKNHNIISITKQINNSRKTS